MLIRVYEESRLVFAFSTYWLLITCFISSPIHYVRSLKLVAIAHSCLPALSASPRSLSHAHSLSHTFIHTHSHAHLYSTLTTTRRTRPRRTMSSSPRWRRCRSLSLRTRSARWPRCPPRSQVCVSVCAVGSNHGIESITPCAQTNQWLE